MRITVTIGLVLGILLVGVPSDSGPLPEIDPALRVLLRAPDSPVSAASQPARPGILASLAAAAPPDVLDVFLRPRGGVLTGPAALQMTRIDGDLYAGRLSVDALRELLAEDAVASVRLARPVFPALDRSSTVLGMASVRRPDLDAGVYRGQTGRGVVVGTVDSGVDWTHPDFRRPDGGTRVHRYWDQIAPGGSAPRGYPYGSEYTERRIDQGIAGGIDADGHGTHVLGIAAGNGAGSFASGTGKPLGGMAPEATLVVVRSNFTEAGVVLGARYFFERADALGLPAVLNLSLGNHFGPHRGTSPFEKALTALLGPGRLIVAAAGNDGQRPVHAEQRFRAREPRTLSVAFPAYSKGIYPYVALEGWYAASDRHRVVVRSPAGDEVGVFEWGTEESTFLDPKGTVRGWHVADLGMNNIYLELSDNPASNRLATGTWTVTLEPLLVHDDSEVDWWLAAQAGFARGAAAAIVSEIDPEETILSPACAPGILAVGAMATRSCWLNAIGVEQCYTSPPPLDEVAYFSSRGPTPDGRVKPEILAPGYGVVSARSSGILPTVMTAEELERLSTPDGLYYLSQGTSMSAPHAAGAVALLLARYPGLTHEQMTSRLVSRGNPVQDWRDGRSAVALHVGEALAPVVDLALSELVPDPGGVLIRWSVSRTRGPLEYRVYRGFDPEGPFTTLAAQRIRGENPFEILDPQPDPGRTHYYRVSAVDEEGLEDSLASLSGDIEGTPRVAFRPPEPNPSGGPVTFRAFVPEGDRSARVRLEIFDAAGRRVAGLDPALPGAGGEGTAIWGLAGADGRRVAAGVYFARFEVARAGSPTEVLVRRLVVLP